MIKTLLQNFIGNFIKGGLMIGIALTIIDLIAKYDGMIQFYAFASASFFLIQLFQYYHIYTIKQSSTDPFILHSVIGGIVYVFYVLLMLILYRLNVAPFMLITICTVLWLILTIGYFFILKSQ